MGPLVMASLFDGDVNVGPPDYASIPNIEIRFTAVTMSEGGRAHCLPRVRQATSPSSGRIRCGLGQVPHSPLAFTQQLEFLGMEAEQTASMANGNHRCGGQGF